MQICYFITSPIILTLSSCLNTVGNIFAYFKCAHVPYLEEAKLSKISMHQSVVSIYERTPACGQNMTETVSESNSSGWYVAVEMNV